MSGGRWRRRLERAGTWWAEATDGAWSRWDPHRADWVGDRTGPPGPVPPLEIPAPPPSGAGAPSIWPRAAEIYLGLLGVTAAVLTVAALVLIPVAALFNGLVGHWLGIDLAVGGFLMVMAVVLACALVFLAIGMAMGDRGLKGTLLGVVITLAGFALVMTAAGLITGTPVWETMLGPGAGVGLLLAVVFTTFQLFFDRDIPRPMSQHGNEPT